MALWYYENLFFRLVCKLLSPCTGTSPYQFIIFRYPRDPRGDFERGERFREPPPPQRDSRDGFPPRSDLRDSRWVGDRQRMFFNDTVHHCYSSSLVFVTVEVRRLIICFNQGPGERTTTIQGPEGW